MNDHIVASDYEHNGGLLAVLWPIFWLISLGMIRAIYGPAADRWSMGRRIRWSALVFAAGFCVLIKHSLEIGNINIWFQTWELIPKQLDLIFSPAHFDYRLDDYKAVFVALLGRGLMVPVLYAIGLKLWVQWTTEQPAEVPLTKRWWARLGLVDVLLAVLAAMCISVASDLRFFPLLAGFVAALMAWPLVMRLSIVNSQGEAMNTEATSELSDERSRVLKLLEDGRITASDAAELLEALTESHVAAGGGSSARRGPMPLDRRLAYAGAAVVLIAFFLPWFTINMNQVAAEMQTMVQNIPANMPRVGMPENWPAVLPPTMAVRTVRGGDAPYGLGWIALAMAMLAAYGPSAFTQWSPAHRRNLRIAAVAVGAILLCYLLSVGYPFADVGLVTAMVGFGLQVVAVVLEVRPMILPTAMRPAAAV